MTSAKTFPAVAAPRFASIGSPYFGIMLAVMAVVLILSNMGASKGVVLGPIVTDGGFFLFPLAYILGDVISEVYGFKVARKAIITTFALSVFASNCYWIIIALPGFDDEFGASKQAALEGALGPVPQIVLASLLAFLAGQTINSWHSVAGHPPSYVPARPAAVSTVPAPPDAARRRARQGTVETAEALARGSQAAGPLPSARSTRYLNSASLNMSFHSIRTKIQPCSMSAFSRRRSANRTSPVG
jgi:MFS family permease